MNLDKLGQFTAPICFYCFNFTADCKRPPSTLQRKPVSVQLFSWIIGWSYDQGEAHVECLLLLTAALLQFSSWTVGVTDEKTELPNSRKCNQSKSFSLEEESTDEMFLTQNKSTFPTFITYEQTVETNLITNLLSNGSDLLNKKALEPNFIIFSTVIFYLQFILHLLPVCKVCLQFYFL